MDIVVAGPNGRLAIECDGDRWHGEDVWHRDRARQEVLERAGWTFERIRGSSFYRDPETAMQPVWQHLSDLGIPTGDEWMVTAPRGVTREVRGTPGEPPVARAHPSPEPAQPVTRDAQSDAAPHVSAPGTDLDESVPPLDEAPDMGDATPEAAATAELTQPEVPAEPEAPAWSPPAWYLAGMTPAAEPEAQPTNSQAEPVPSAAAEFRPPSWYRPATDDAPATEAAAPTAVSAESGIGAAVPPMEQPHAGALTSAPYRMWTPRPVPPVDSRSRVEVMAALAEIIEAEGPMHAQRVYQLYVKASGGARVGREAQRTFVALTASGVRTGKWLRVKDRISELPEATLYMPGHPAVLVRTRGPRELQEIPRSEIRSLVDQLELPLGDPEVKRALLRQLGFVRLTERTSQYLDECLRYSWTT